MNLGTELKLGGLEEQRGPRSTGQQLCPQWEAQTPTLSGSLVLPGRVPAPHVISGASVVQSICQGLWCPALHTGSALLTDLAKWLYLKFLILFLSQAFDKTTENMNTFWKTHFHFKLQHPLETTVKMY